MEPEPVVEPEPIIEAPEEEVPLADLPDEEVPLAGVPRTGDPLLLYAALAAVSGLAWVGLKKKDEE